MNDSPPKATYLDDYPLPQLAGRGQLVSTGLRGLHQQLVAKHLLEHPGHVALLFNATVLLDGQDHWEAVCRRSQLSSAGWGGGGGVGGGQGERSPVSQRQPPPGSRTWERLALLACRGRQHSAEDLLGVTRGWRPGRCICV